MRKRCHGLNQKDPPGDFYVADCIVWHEEIRISLIIYDNVIFRVLSEDAQPPAAAASDNNAAKWRAV